MFGDIWVVGGWLLRGEQPLFDIDVQSEITPENEAVLAPEPNQAGKPGEAMQQQKAVEKEKVSDNGGSGAVKGVGERLAIRPEGKHAGLATPAVRGMLKELDIKITDVKGTGRDGRVLKEDIQNHVHELDSRQAVPPPTTTDRVPGLEEPQVEKPITLTPIQSQMFKTMTRSLSIPHFLYADEIDITSLSSLRARLNAESSNTPKLSYLHFIIKAVSIALADFPLLNARVETGDSPQSKPQLIMRQNHNVGMAMDTPQGLLVPNIKNVAARSISDISAECIRLQSLAREAKLSAKDLTRGTITVSNIGSIGGTYVAPVIVQSEVAILGLGKARSVPAFDETGQVVKRETMCFSWSADHRVVDGATMARMAERVKELIEKPERMIVRLR